MTQFLITVYDAIQVHARQLTYAGVSIMLVVVMYATYALITAPAPAEPAASLPTPRFILGSEEDATTAFTASGIVEPVDDVTLQAKTSGTLIQFPYNAGDTVTAGSPIAIVEHDMQSAAVVSAQAALKQAQAQLEKVKNGTRAEQLAVLSEQVRVADAKLDAARQQARTALLNAYASMDAAFPGGIDVIYTNVRTANPTINLATTNYAAKIRAESARLVIRDYLTRHEHQTALEDAALSAEIPLVRRELQKTKSTLDDVLAVLDGTRQTGAVLTTELDDYIATALERRAAVIEAISTVSEAENALRAAASAHAIATSQEAEGVTGARPEDVASAEAAVLSAQGVYAQAQARLDDAYIYAPFNGTLMDTFATRGQTVSAGTPLARIASQDGWKVVVHTSDAHAPYVTKGTTVYIHFRNASEPLEAHVDRVIPALASESRTLRFEIFLPDLPSHVHSGATVSISIPQRTTEVDRVALQDDMFRIPNQFVGYGYDGAYVVADDAVVPITLITRATEYSTISNPALTYGMVLTHPLSVE